MAIRHRNHLGVCTFNTVPITLTPTVVDFTDGSTPTYGTDAQDNSTGVFTMWSGDGFADGVIKYTGPNNDRDEILVEIGGAVPTNTSSGYLQEDLNLDGTVKYTGVNNDRDLILQNIGGTVPTNTRTEQLP